MTNTETLILENIPSTERLIELNSYYVEKEEELEKARKYKAQNGKHRVIDNLVYAKILGMRDVEKSNHRLPLHILRDFSIPELRKAGISEERIKKIKARQEVAIDNKSAIGRGKTFERKVYNYIKKQQEKGYIQATVLYGSWIEYQDKNGLGYAQPDILVFPTGTDYGVIIECKLTQTEEAISQLACLYKPLISHLFPERKVYLLQAFANIKQKINEVFSLIDFLRCPKPNVNNWHFLE